VHKDKRTQVEKELDDAFQARQQAAYKSYLESEKWAFMKTLKQKQAYRRELQDQIDQKRQRAQEDQQVCSLPNISKTLTHLGTVGKGGTGGPQETRRTMAATANLDLTARAPDVSSNSRQLARGDPRENAKSGASERERYAAYGQSARVGEQEAAADGEEEKHV
jgi:predicted TIM-barrel fold metal-dependent hydrolase